MGKNQVGGKLIIVETIREELELLTLIQKLIFFCSKLEKCIDINMAELRESGESMQYLKVIEHANAKN